MATAYTAGRLATASPTRRHIDTFWTTPSTATRGMRGQKIQRPKQTMAAGSATITNVAATTTPIAQASPSPRVAGKADSTIESRPTNTVAALLVTVSAVRRHATAMASRRSSYRFSSSLYREISSSA